MSSRPVATSDTPALEGADKSRAICLGMAFPAGSTLPISHVHTPPVITRHHIPQNQISAFLLHMRVLNNETETPVRVCRSLCLQVAQFAIGAGVAWRTYQAWLSPEGWLENEAQVGGWVGGWAEGSGKDTG
mgnify:CR=1 FL=1